MPRSFRRSQPTLSLKPKIIVACEGSKTERFYLRRIQQIHRLLSVQFEILDHEGTDPKTIVGQLAERIRREKRQRAWDVTKDEAWAIFDGDEHQQSTGNRANWNDAIQQSRDLKINLAITNPSVEFWYLIHFQDQRSSLTRYEALRHLKRHYPSYDKNLPMYDDLKSNTGTAIQRAKTLLDIALQNEIGEFDNPCCCGIANLIEKLTNLE